MATTMSLPELGENVESALVVKVLVEVGESIEREQPVIEVETEKASVEVPSTIAGTVSELHVAEGEQVRSGAAILSVEEDLADATPEHPGDGHALAEQEPTQGPERDDEPWPEAAQARTGPTDESEGAVASGAGTAEPNGQVETSPTRPEVEREIVVRLPELGENIDGADVVKVLVGIGDRVEAGQGILELETEKATVEVPSSAAGVVQAVHVAEGDRIHSGAELVTVRGRTAAAGPAPAASERAAAPAERGAEPPRPAPERPATTPSPAPAPPPASPAHVAPLWSGSPVPHTRVPAAPSVRRFAREVGIDITEVSGTGPGGRITSEDVKEHVKAQLVRSSGAAHQAPSLPDFSRWGEVTFEEMTSVRRITAEQMARAWRTVPQVTQHDLADITELEELRVLYRKRIEARGGKLTLTAILVKIAASALRVFPSLNASVDMENHRVVRKGYVHIGVAVDTERGLLVPVIRDADRKSIATIARELDDLAQRARNRKLGPDEMQGASFTISNLGGIGGTGFSPIVNWPEVAILGVSRGRIQPEWKDGDWRPRLMMPLSLSYDHRLVDGADAARFTRWVAEALERPLLVLLEGDRPA